ncbi:hypothetical protein IW262DRAFT_1452995 [Armillaria fumosa]|nr:hypothetical protein IW262DRAFT_1452995 [Armillaria fumosa]
MPRAELTKVAHSTTTSLTLLAGMSSTMAPSNAPAGAKKKHICGTCERAFTTSGHLARHSRVHTGERNHKCPFPGCETRCSRQDNLQQHYRIHLSPGSRRNSARSVISRVMNSPGSGLKRGVSPPPALEPARLYSHHSQSPPDSPPPLTQATLPATALRSSEPASPDSPYSHLSMPPTPTSYSYRTGTSTYQEQPGSGYTYVHTTPSPPTQYYEVASSASSRHSISHISPPSPESNSSGPPTPASYPAVYDQAEYRYESPPPVLAPIQGGRRDSLGVAERHYIHQPQPYYQQEVSLGHGAWKGGLKSGLVQQT